MSAPGAERFRVLLRLAPDADADAVLAAAEESLGRSVEVINRLRTVPVLSVSAGRSELEILRRVPGVAAAEPEGRCELPPRPIPSRK